MKISTSKNSLAIIFALTTVCAISSPANSAPSSNGPDNIDFAEILKMPKVMVETQISITWSDGSAVIGAKVFDHRSNTILGVTNQFGKLTLTVPNGSLLRIVDPNYGQQQSLRLVQGKKKNDRELMATSSTSPYSSVLVEGWSL